MKFGDSQLIESVLEIVRKRFGVPVILQTESFDFNGGHDPARNQTNSNWILKQLLDRFPSSQSKILGLTERDLYCPVLTYVFGEAALGGQVAVPPWDWRRRKRNARPSVSSHPRWPLAVGARVPPRFVQK